MKTCILYGSKEETKIFSEKIRDKFEIIVTAHKENEIADKNLDIPIYICDSNYYEIAESLFEKNRNNLFVVLDGFVYHYQPDSIMIPCELELVPQINIQKNRNPNILFIKNNMDLDIIKFISQYDTKENNIHLLYLNTIEQMKQIETYCSNIVTVYTFLQLSEFINRNSFSQIYCIDLQEDLISLIEKAGKNVTIINESAKELNWDSSGEDIIEEYLMKIRK